MVLQADKIFGNHLTKLDEANFSSVSADGIAFPSPFSSVSFFSASSFPNEVKGNCDSSLTYTCETQFVIHIYELEYYRYTLYNKSVILYNIYYMYIRKLKQRTNTKTL